MLLLKKRQRAANYDNGEVQQFRDPCDIISYITCMNWVCCRQSIVLGVILTFDPQLIALAWSVILVWALMLIHRAVWDFFYSTPSFHSLHLIVRLDREETRPNSTRCNWVPLLQITRSQWAYTDDVPFENAYSRSRWVERRSNRVSRSLPGFLGRKSKYVRMDDVLPQEHEEDDGGVRVRRSQSSRRYVFACSVFASLNSVLLLGYGN